MSAELAPGDYDSVEETALARFLAASVDGFHAGGDPVAYEFFVRFPEARWAARNLPRPLRVTSVDGGVVVRGESAAIPVIASRVVGLGEAARVLSEDLRREVVALARGALRSNERVLRKSAGRAVGSSHRLKARGRMSSVVCARRAYSRTVQSMRYRQTEGRS